MAQQHADMQGQQKPSMMELMLNQSQPQQNPMQFISPYLGMFR